MLIPSGKIFTTIRKNAKMKRSLLPIISQTLLKIYYNGFERKAGIIAKKKYHSGYLIVQHHISSSIDLALSIDITDQLEYTV